MYPSTTTTTPASRIALREKEPVQLAAFREQGRFRRVEVLGLALAQHAAAEADHLAPAVVDREHDPVAKTVVSLAAFPGDDEARRFERRVVVAGKGGGEGLPRVGGIADPEPGGDRAGKAPLLEIGDGARRLLQLCAIEPGRVQRERRQVRGPLAAVGFAGALDPRHLEPRVARQFLDRVGKRLAPILHQEADRRSVRAAAEAVIELLGRTDRERGRLLAMERTAGLVIRPGLLQRDVPVDQIDDVDPGKQRLDEIIRNHVLDAAPGDVTPVQTPRCRAAGSMRRQGSLAL
jgi:hypothetical protein